MMNVFKVVGVIVLILGLFALSIGVGWLDLQGWGFLEKEKTDIEREIFEENKSHVKGMIDDLADYRYQWQTAESDTAKSAIEDLVRSKFSDFNRDNINDENLKQWLEDVINGRL